MIDNDAVKQKYGNFWGEVFDSVVEFRTKYMTEDYLFVIMCWYEDGNTYVEVGDNNMWSELIIINGIHELEEFN